MVSLRKISFINNYYYHVFNRAVDRKTIFKTRYEYIRATELLYFYQFNRIPLRYSHFNRLSNEKQTPVIEIMEKSGKRVDVIAYCLMPNHFHLLLKQREENGITSYLSNFTNGFTRYFNTKYKRDGVLFQGVFKAVFIENDEQLLHVTRYIHLNPLIASLVNEDQLKYYSWSSFNNYIEKKGNKIITLDSIQSILNQVTHYEEFVHKQISYAKELDDIKHSLLK